MPRSTRRKRVDAHDLPQVHDSRGRYDARANATTRCMWRRMLGVACSAMAVRTMSMSAGAIPWLLRKSRAALAPGSTRPNSRCWALRTARSAVALRRAFQRPCRRHAVRIPQAVPSAELSRADHRFCGWRFEDGPHGGLYKHGVEGATHGLLENDTPLPSWTLLGGLAFAGCTVADNQGVPRFP